MELQDYKIKLPIDSVYNLRYNQEKLFNYIMLIMQIKLLIMYNLMYGNKSD